MTALTEHDEPIEAAIALSSVVTPMSTEITLAERLESLKAGLLGALTAGLMFGALVLMNGWLSLRFTQLTTLSIDTDGLLVLTSGAIAALSGFLFGVTYRYIIRQDQNPHLKDGAVLAFGLVRGLAQAEGKLHEAIVLLPLMILGIESVLLFAGARVVLDWTLYQGWVEPFGTLTAVNNTSERLPTTNYTVNSSNSG